MKPKLLISAVTWKGHSKAQLLVFINSLKLQTRQDFKVLIAHDGPSPAGSSFDGIAEEYQSEQYLFRCSDHERNIHGMDNRQKAIDFAYDHEIEYISFFNVDDYFTPIYVETMLGTIERKGLDGCYCNLVHHSIGYRLHTAGPALYSIDMGCFVIKTEIAKELGMGEESIADGLFWNQLVIKFPNAKHERIDSILYVHN